MPAWHRELWGNERLERRPAFPPTRNGDREFHRTGRLANRKTCKQEDLQTGRLAMAQLRLTETTANTIRDRYQTLFAKAFTPNIRYEQMPAADERIAYAAEYAAYRLGQIDEKLGRLIDIMERATAQSSQA
jgi:hypothetical protein